MKVKELIKLLAEENQEAEVIMSSDGEGNSYSPFYCLGDVDTYKADSTWSGDMGYSKLTKELKDAGYGDGDIITDGKPAVLLCPSN